MAAAGIALFLPVVASRAEAVAIVDAGDGDGTASYLTLALLQGSGGGKVVSAKGGDNYAVALNTKDGTNVIETAFLIAYAANGVVDQENAAVAYASCDSCGAYAAAIEVASGRRRSWRGSSSGTTTCWSWTSRPTSSTSTPGACSSTRWGGSPAGSYSSPTTGTL